MTRQDEMRRFARNVLLVATLANAGAAMVVQGERSAQPFLVATAQDRSLHQLAESISAYGQASADLIARFRGEPRP